MNTPPQSYLNFVFRLPPWLRTFSMPSGEHGPLNCTMKSLNAAVPTGAL